VLADYPFTCLRCLYASHGACDWRKKQVPGWRDLRCHLPNVDFGQTR